MRRVTLRALWEHKRRLVSTVVAVVLGVAFMSGTFVFADTIDRVFDDLFSDAFEEVETQVRGTELFDTFGGTVRERLDPGTVDVVAAVEGVRAVAPYVQTVSQGPTNRVLTDDGFLGPQQGPPTLIESWITDDVIRPYQLTDGSMAPTADDEVALNVAAAEEGELDIGDEVRLLTQFGESSYTLVGTFRFGAADSAAGSISVNVTLAEAQRLTGFGGQIQAILVDAAPGVDEETLTARIGAVLPDGAEAVTGTTAAEETAEQVQSGFAFFRQILTVFGAIALVVGTFIISNTFAILLTQRTRELALLRAIGASRRQVLTSVLSEAVVIGLVAAVLGLLGGIALAFGVTALLDAVGAELPSRGLVVSSRTVVIATSIGLVVTLVSSLVPAIHATQVPPLAAMRDVAVDRSQASRRRAALGIVVLVLAGVFLVLGVTAEDGALERVGIGAFALIVGAIVIGPVLATPSVRILGAGLPRLRGVTGQLARENAARSPKRTAATASALLIAVALVGFLRIFGASVSESVTDAVTTGFDGDLIVQAQGGFGGPASFPATVADTLEDSPLVDRVVPAAFFGGQITYPDGDRESTFLSAFDGELAATVLNADMEIGRVADLAPGGIILDRETVEDRGLSLGDEVTVLATSGRSRTLMLVAVSDDFATIGPGAMHIADQRAIVDEDTLAQVILTVVDDPGTGEKDVESAKTDLELLLADVPDLDVLDADDYADSLAAQINGVLTLINALLGLSVVIAMIGIANTLSLSVHERTRELGLLRAVGMTRSQLRSAVRWEAALIAVLGTVVGVGIGMVVSWAVVRALADFGLGRFVVPVDQLVVVVLVVGGLGVLASIRPARRAARLDVLTAIATE